MGVNNLLNIGNSALFANQVALNVTGNNVANVDTDGYCRQSVRFEEARPIDHIRPGQIGMGVYAAEVYRNFNRFVENAYLDRFSQQSRWAEQSSILQTVENIFNESNSEGISSHLSSFFAAWNKLEGTPESQATREALLAESENLAALLRNSHQSLVNTQREMDTYIQQSVDEVNKLLEDILQINKQIAVTDVPKVNNANSLYDERDKLVRRLTELVDVRVDDKGRTDFQIFTKSGQPLLSEMTAFKLQFREPPVEKETKGFYGTLNYNGSDANEYTLEFVDGGNFRVSLDGGRSWLRDDNGQITTFAAPPAGQTLQVKNLEISFDYQAGDKFTSGDRFLIVPKKALLWDTPTREPINITPQTFSDGEENPMRLTGGKIASYFNVRDYHVGRYIDKLDAMSKSLIWEVNALHSQGTGLLPLTNMQGTYTVGRPDLPIGSLNSQTPYSQNLEAGNLNIYFYDAANGASIAPASPMKAWALDFANPPALDGTVTNFDPKTHSLHDVVDAINRSFPDPANPGRNLLTASLDGNKISIQSADGVNFRMGTDTTGLLAALGLNTFFQGSGAGDISLNPVLKGNVSLVNAQSVDGQKEGNVGDNLIAARIAQLMSKEVKISTMWEHENASLQSYYGGLVGIVGADTRNAMFNEQYNTTLADDLSARSDAITGVNLDEEMTNLIRFQHAYTAAAKLITTADQMMETILGLKQ